MPISLQESLTNFESTTVNQASLLPGISWPRRRITTARLKLTEDGGVVTETFRCCCPVLWKAMCTSRLYLVVGIFNDHCHVFMFSAMSILLISCGEFATANLQFCVYFLVLYHMCWLTISCKLWCRKVSDSINIEATKASGGSVADGLWPSGPGAARRKALRHQDVDWGNWDICCFIFTQS